jgi:SAM-dependent methyltransferase
LPENPDLGKKNLEMIAGGSATQGETSLGKIDLEWNDDDVLPAVLSLDTEFVFRRMTEETLAAAQSENGRRILDVGCGRGIDAASLAQRGGLLFACEPSRVMLEKAKNWVKNSGQGVELVRSLAEYLPFRSKAFARVVCKGAIDHFANPDRAVSEMCRVVAQEGKVVISVANYESLSCWLAKKLNGIFQRLLGREVPPPHIWKIPADHTFKFDYSSIVILVQRYLQIQNIQGVSLLWGFPRWSNFLRIIPRKVALTILRLFDGIALRHPPWGDVLILISMPFKKYPGRERSEANG